MRFPAGRRRLARAAMAAAVAGTTGAARRTWAQQAYPSRPIRLIVPFAPGGGVDATGRIIANHLSPALGQPVVVENRAGAGGVVGVEVVAKAAPDGYTIGMVSPGNMTAGPAVRPAPYDPLSLGFVTRAVQSPLLFVCRKDLPAGSMAEFVALAKAQPGQIRFASGGVGTGQHLAGELLSIRLGARMVHVPYRGTGPAMTDIVAGNVDVYFGDTSVWPATQQGQARLLAVSSASRWRQSPDTPAIREAVPDFDISNWYGVVAPPGTPDEILERLRDEIAKVLAKEEVVEMMRRIGFDPAPLPPREFAAFVRAELATWASVVQTAGIRAD